MTDFKLSLTTEESGALVRAVASDRRVSLDLWKKVHDAAFVKKSTASTPTPCAEYIPLVEPLAAYSPNQHTYFDFTDEITGRPIIIYANILSPLPTEKMRSRPMGLQKLAQHGCVYRIVDALAEALGPKRNVSHSQIRQVAAQYCEKQERLYPYFTLDGSVLISSYPNGLGPHLFVHVNPSLCIPLAHNAPTVFCLFVQKKYCISEDIALRWWCDLRPFLT
jgi:hypothetical protein